MDRLQAMQVYTRIVELKAFGKAADSLQMPRTPAAQAHCFPAWVHADAFDWLVSWLGE